MASNGKNGKLTMFLIAVLLVVLTFSVSTFAWYTLSDNNKSNIHVQTYDSYSINLSDIAVDPVLDYGGSVAKDDLQSNGEKVVYGAEGAEQYNTFDGRVAYVIAKIPINVTNFAGEAQEWNITINDFDVLDGESSGTSDNNVLTRIKSDIMLQFISFDESDSDKITGIHYAETTDTSPSPSEWKNVSDKPTCAISIDKNGDTAVYVAVAFAVTDDAIDEAYLGMSIKIIASASKKSA